MRTCICVFVLTWKKSSFKMESTHIKLHIYTQYMSRQCECLIEIYFGYLPPIYMVFGPENGAISLSPVTQNPLQAARNLSSVDIVLRTR